MTQQVNGSAAAFALAFQNVVREVVREELRPVKEEVKNQGLQLDRIEKHLAPPSHVP